jgi:hypothetical protein
VIDPAALPDDDSSCRVVGWLPTVIVSDALPVGDGDGDGNGDGEGDGEGDGDGVEPRGGGVEPPPPPPQAVSIEIRITQAANFLTITVLTHRHTANSLGCSPW